MLEINLLLITHLYAHHGDLTNPALSQQKVLKKTTTTFIYVPSINVFSAGNSMLASSSVTMAVMDDKVLPCPPSD